MEINFAWFDDEDVLEPPPSYERIFFCNQENNQILEFEINRAEADHVLRMNSPVEEYEFNGYPRPKSPPEFYVKKNSIISDIPIPSSPKPPPVPFEQLVPPPVPFEQLVPPPVPFEQLVPPPVPFEQLVPPPVPFEQLVP